MDDKDDRVSDSNIPESSQGATVVSTAPTAAPSDQQQTKAETILSSAPQIEWGALRGGGGCFSKPTKKKGDTTVGLEVLGDRTNAVISRGHHMTVGGTTYYAGDQDFRAPIETLSRGR